MTERETSLSSNPSHSCKEGNTHNRERKRETSLTSNRSPSRKGGKRA